MALVLHIEGMDDKIALDQEFEDKMNALLEELVQLFINHDHDLKNFAFLLTSAVLRGLEEKFPTNEFAIHPILSAIVFHIDDNISDDPKNDFLKIGELNMNKDTLQ